MTLITRYSLAGRRSIVAIGLAVLAFAAGCGSSSDTPSAGSATKSSAATTTPTTTAATVASMISNTWSGAKIDPKKLPIGDKSISLTGAGVGKMWSCRAGNPNAGGAQADGPWLDVAGGTWDSTSKLAVEGAVSWPTAKYTEKVSGSKRILTTNDLPVDGQTGTFPIAADDPSYAYDRNPGSIKEMAITVTLDATAEAAASPSCMDEGPVGMLKNGVLIFNALDGRGQDAVAHESQDRCDGHPAMTTYHYHNVPSCLRSATTGPSTVVGWMYDGFPIVLERDASGALPTNADLDECHGRTSPVLVDGKIVNTYHYSVTLEFPYSIGCYRGTAVAVR